MFGPPVNIQHSWLKTKLMSIGGNLAIPFIQINIKSLTFMPPINNQHAWFPTKLVNT